MSKQAGQTKTAQTQDTKPKSDGATTPAAKSTTQEQKKPDPKPDFNAKPVAVFHGAQGKDKPVTIAELRQFVQEKAKGMFSSCLVEPLDNVDKTTESPLPYTRMTGGGKRATIAWMLVNGADGDRRLHTIVAEAGKLGMSGTKMADIIAGLNGGFSESSKTYGTAYIRIAAYPVKS